MDVGALEACSSAERADAIDQLHALVTVTHSQLLQVVAECDRREDWREDGATSMADWLVARLGIAHRTAREWVRVARSLEELPKLAETFAEGGLSFDQLVPVTRLASPRPRRPWPPMHRGSRPPSWRPPPAGPGRCRWPRPTRTIAGATCVSDGTTTTASCASRAVWPMPRERWWPPPWASWPPTPRPIR